MSETDKPSGNEKTGESEEPETEATTESPTKRRKESMGQTIGGVLFGFEQQVLRTMPPPQELVHHARPDAPVPAGDGSLIHIGMPGLDLPDGPPAPVPDPVPDP